MYKVILATSSKRQAYRIHISAEQMIASNLYFVLCIIQVAGGEERRRTLTPLALRERYSALSESGLGKTQCLHAAGGHRGALTECHFPCFFLAPTELVHGSD